MMVDISSTLMAALGDNGSNGMKDMQGDVSSTVSTVFRRGKARTTRDINDRNNKRRKKSDGSPGKFATTPRGVDVVLRAVDHFGDNSKTLDCLWMNVNRVSYVDPTLDKCCAALEWLSGADTYRSYRSNVAMNNGAEHQSMQKYHIPTAAAAVHLLCSVETRPDLTFSTRPLSDCHYQNQANVSLIHRFVEGLPPRARRGIGGGTDTVVSDVIPYGLWLLSAGDGKHALSRPVSSVDILSDEEKLAFSAHVQTLRDLGLTYVKDGGTFDYGNTNNLRLEPEIDKLVKFEFMNDCISRREIPPLLKELLAHGATVAALRERESEALIAQQASAAREKDRQKPKDDGIAQPAGAEKPTAATPVKIPNDKAASNSSASKNFLGFRAAKAKEAKTARRAANVGFDRSKTTKLSNTGSGVEISKVIRFKYQKGFTQAVRAPCQMEDLL
jgi:chromosome transmission fidelity protein 18